MNRCSETSLQHWALLDSIIAASPATATPVQAILSAVSSEHFRPHVRGSEVIVFSWLRRLLPRNRALATLLVVYNLLALSVYLFEYDPLWIIAYPIGVVLYAFSSFRAFENSIIMLSLLLMVVVVIMAVVDQIRGK